MHVPVCNILIMNKEMMQIRIDMFGDVGIGMEHREPVKPQPPGPYPESANWY